MKHIKAVSWVDIRSGGTAAVRLPRSAEKGELSAACKKERRQEHRTCFKLNCPCSCHQKLEVGGVDRNSATGRSK